MTAIEYGGSQAPILQQARLVADRVAELLRRGTRGDRQGQAAQRRLELIRPRQRHGLASAKLTAKADTPAGKFSARAAEVVWTRYGTTSSASRSCDVVWMPWAAACASRSVCSADVFPSLEDAPKGRPKVAERPPSILERQSGNRRWVTRRRTPEVVSARRACTPKGTAVQLRKLRPGSSRGSVHSDRPNTIQRQHGPAIRPAVPARTVAAGWGDCSACSTACCVLARSWMPWPGSCPAGLRTVAP